MVDAPHTGAFVRTEPFPTTIGAAWGEERLPRRDAACALAEAADETHAPRTAATVLKRWLG